MTRKSLNASVREAAIPPVGLMNLGDDELALALAYYRVSTTEQANTSYDDEGFSIQAQRDYCGRKAADLPARIIKEFIDKGRSARTADRPDLQGMLRYIATHPEIRYVIVHKLDRLARNREDDVQIGMFLAKHGVRLVSATENIDETPGGKLVHGIMATIAEWYSGNLSQEARKGMRKKVEIGGTPGKAPLGYLNIRDKRKGKDIGLVIVDEVMGPIITEGFKLYATGLYTLGTLTEELNHRGLRLPETKSLPERPVSVQTAHRILHNRYYLGVVTYNAVEYQGEQTPLTDEETFEMVQALLHARNLNKEKSKKRPHPLKGNLHCARCGRRLGITAPTNRYGMKYAYFYCLGRQADTRSCDQPYISVAELEHAAADYFRRVRIPVDRLKALRAEVLAAFEGKHAEGETAVAAAQARIQRAKQRAAKNKEAYFADALSLEDFKVEQDKTREEIKAAEKVIARWSVELDAIKRALDQACSLLLDPHKLFVNAPDAIRLLLTQAIFEKLWVMDAAVVGAELTDTYAELLTIEARLAEEANERADRALAELAVIPAPRMDYRRVGVITGDDGEDLADLAGRLWVERPQGVLPVDGLNCQNPASPGVMRGSDVNHLVGVTGFEPATSSSRTKHATKLRHTPVTVEKSS
jgi:site-specific DNA recombinase